MNIDKAIELLNRSQRRYPNILDLDTQDAIKLGIEALKLLENPTDPRLIYTRKLLLGMTEE